MIPLPWHIQDEHPSCPASKPYGVVLDDGGDLEGCHATKDDAEKQLAALYANEGGRTGRRTRGMPNETKVRERDFGFTRDDDLRDCAMRGLELAVAGDIPGWVGAGGKRARKYDLPRLRQELDEALGEADGFNLIGHSAVFGQWTTIRDFWDGEYEERIAKGAFAKTLTERGDRVVVQLDHGRHPMVGSLPVAATRAMWEDDVGLFAWDRLHQSEFFAPVREAIMSGSIKGQSFRFELLDSVDERNRDGSLARRTVTEVVLYERGPVIFPAYVGSSVAVRSWVDALPEELRLALSMAVSPPPARDVGIVTLSTSDEGAARDGHADESEAADQNGPAASVTRTERRRMAAALRGMTSGHSAGAASAAA